MMQGKSAGNNFKAGVDISSNFVDKNNRNQNRRLKTSKKTKLTPGKIILLFLAGYLIFSFGQTYWQIVQMNKKIAHYESIKNDLLEEQKKLESEYEKLQNPEYIERQARKKLGLVKPGEKIIMPAKPGEVVPLDEPSAGEIMD